MIVYVVLKGITDPPCEQVRGVYACLGSAENRADELRQRNPNWNSWTFSNNGQFRIWSNDYTDSYVAIEEHELKN